MLSYMTMYDSSNLFSITIGCKYEKAIKTIRKILQKGGFEIVSEINISKLIKAKLGIKYHNYVILEILTPFMTYKSMLTDIKAGLFIPIRLIIVEENYRKITISILNPDKDYILTENRFLKLILLEEMEKLRNTIINIQIPSIIPIIPGKF